MKFIDIEQIRPKVCPIGSDNCKGCEYLEWMKPEGEWINCKYEDNDKDQTL